ncbi:protein of unknown function [Paenibacillus sp. UNC496MF]|uniref:four-helix bundle copper-binding protein n=1 Tax=Paenibacillus sp. UNC496MF TaxID=1502753 RepID=UPI0008E5377E|nr:four-helix bundle copper-binding protein [Paenibacillus sp. UNC496MF]SFI80410.1 protein of unknown function [Paenibacillus sp. UNC496MF]
MSREQIELCIAQCLACMQACNHCFDACLREEEAPMMADCIRHNRECADLCAFAAQALDRGSPYARALCRLCADACEACGETCLMHASEHCRLCAEACFACAKACRGMAA